MSAAFAEFAAVVNALAPRTAVVLGSGLGGVTSRFVEKASVAFGDVPGLVPTTVHGHRGRLAVGEWGGVPALILFGRLHFYEGHPWNVVTGTIRAAAELGVTSLLLTNAAGGIHDSLSPGGLMAIRGHIKIVDRDAWRDVTVRTPYEPRCLRRLEQHRLLAGVYAALTGPCYETPAEIRALKAMGADAVGMSTAKEAECAASLGLEVAAISCITNKAAGLGGETLDHAEVLDNAKLAVARLETIVVDLISAPS
ncbi:MAG TPA: purine-nucleoside phosphorylase [Gemmataceae bacterium]|nr:purine-nucleoside phosphorylase [Gemmataceae bacterium]